ncbi:MAG: ABC transporter substrate-binding protein, partial [Alphaproteobacteria bacterium]|nr:ABC transporter substrate-binding protein [Alphaproteobacteria bacterium]
MIGRLAAVLGSAALVMAVAGASAQGKKDVVWSVHVDITGPASYSGAQQAAGFKDYVAWKNSQGGIRGRKIRLILTDTTFKPAVAV